MALNILVVDDSSVMRAILIKALRLSRLPIGQICEAANGAEGLRALDQHWIDLLLVDINMPVMNGIEMIERLRHMPTLSNLPIIVVSTESSHTRIEMLQNNGASFVHKPFSAEVLRETILRLTGISDEHGTE